MSTYWYFECVDHDPPLRSGDEFTQHTDDAAYRNALALVGQRPLDPAWWDGDQGGAGGYMERNARRFLGAHPTCRLAAVSEHDDRVPLSPSNEPCTAETHSWDHYRSTQMDPYWIRCTLTEHDADTEHYDSNTGLRWKADQ